MSPERSRGFEWIAADALLHPDGEARELGWGLDYAGGLANRVCGAGACAVSLVVGSGFVAMGGAHDLHACAADPACLPDEAEVNLGEFPAVLAIGVVLNAVSGLALFAW